MPWEAYKGPRELKGLTLTQPWATLVALGVKTIETRSWSTSYRGLLVIYAAAGLGGLSVPDRTPRESDLAELCGREPYLSALRDAHGAEEDPADMAAWLPRGKAVAVVELAAVLSTGHKGRPMDLGLADAMVRNPGEGRFGDFSPGRYGWVLRDVVPVDVAVPAPRFKRGLWDCWGKSRDVLVEAWESRMRTGSYWGR